MALGARRMQWREGPSHWPHQWMYCWFFLFCFPWLSPLQKEQPCTNSLDLFWNNLEFTVELYHWYTGIKKKKAGIFNMLSLYLNYLSTVTLIYFVNIQYINVASHNQHWWHAVQFDFPLSEHPLNCIIENALGAWLWKKKNSGVNGLGRLPPAGPGPDQAHLCFLLLSEQMSKTEKLYQWEGKGGQVKVTLPFLKGVTLDCCICSLWRLTKCSVADLLVWWPQWHGKGGKWTDAQPAG